MTANSIEISIKGKWFTVPALYVNEKAIITRGNHIKLAVIEAEEWLETELDDPESCIKILRDQRSDGLRADIFTFAQKLPHTVPRYKYPMEWDSVAATRINSYKAWWENLPQESRKNVRRAKKRGVEVRLMELNDQLIRGIVGVNNDSAMRQRVPYTHFGKSFDQVKKDQASFPDRSSYICAYYGDELIGFLKMIHRGDIASILQILPKISHADKRPSNAMIAKAVEVCEAKGFSYLTYGMFNYGNKKDSSLREFKSRNGFEEILVPRFYIPLTTKGTIAFKLGLHHGLRGLLPHSMITMINNLRAQVYAIKMCRCSSTIELPNRNRQMGSSIPPTGSNT
jgi:hypothetical protein